MAPMSKAATTTERRERFEALVHRAERLIEESPRGYRLRIGALALLGYAVIFGILLVLVALLGGTLWAAFASTALFLILLKKKVIIVLAIMAWVLLKALWVRFERPEGLPVTAEQAPALFAEIADIRRALDLPRIHEVLLTDEFNAAMAQSPRLGVLGWHRNSLILGIPLLLALGPEEMRAVIAHEAGHLSGNHSRFNGWIYRVRTTWYRVMEAFDEAEGLGAAVLRRFFDWYAPYFNAMSFALARANEYEADAVSVELTSPGATASALTGAMVRGDVASDAYWQPLYGRAREQAEPDPAPYRGLARFHRTHDVDVTALDRRIEQALSMGTGHDDTHPSLKDRLAAIGEPPVRQFNASPSAGEAWLGDSLAPLLEKLDSQWLQRNEEAWRAHYENTQEELSVLDELAARERGSLEPLELWRLASLTEQYRDEDQALALFREYASREPEDRDADFVVGRLLLARDDASGIAHMERATEVFGHALPACEHVYGYFLRAGDRVNAEAWRLRGEQHIDLQNQARAERAALNKKDIFTDSALPAEWLERLREQLAGRGDVRHAWIARKQVTVAPEIPLYVIAVQTRGWFKSNAKVIGALANDFETPGECFFVARAGDTKAIARKVARTGDQIL